VVVQHRRRGRGGRRLSFFQFFHFSFTVYKRWDIAVTSWEDGRKTRAWDGMGWMDGMSLAWVVRTSSKIETRSRGSVM
jgi:hypothetical protein